VGDTEQKQYSQPRTTEAILALAQALDTVITWSHTAQSAGVMVGRLDWLRWTSDLPGSPPVQP